MEDLQVCKVLGYHLCNIPAREEDVDYCATCPIANPDIDYGED